MIQYTALTFCEVPYVLSCTKYQESYKAFGLFLQSTLFYLDRFSQLEESNIWYEDKIFCRVSCMQWALQAMSPYLNFESYFIVGLYYRPISVKSDKSLHHLKLTVSCYLTFLWLRKEMLVKIIYWYVRILTLS